MQDPVEMIKNAKREAAGWTVYWQVPLEATRIIIKRNINFFDFFPPKFQHHELDPNCAILVVCVKN